MSSQKKSIFYRLVHSLQDWKGTDIPIGATGIYILVRPAGNGRGGARLSFSTMQKP